MALTEVPHRGAFDRDPFGRIQRGRPLLIGPVCSIEATRQGAIFPPTLDRRGQGLREATRLAWRPVDMEARQAPCLSLREPPPHGGAMHAQIVGDSPALAAATGHQDRLAPLPESPVSGRLAEVCQVRWCRRRSCNPPHLFSPPLMRQCRRGYLKKDARSSDVCISSCKRYQVKATPTNSRRNTGLRLLVRMRA
jgi:hypothetical protein